MFSKWTTKLYRHRNVCVLLVTLALFLSAIGFLKSGDKIQFHAFGAFMRPLGEEYGLIGSRVLVTGGAGFIGFHLARTLSKDKSITVIAMDNFNDYYDVQLKIDRAYELQKVNVTVYNEDLCNEDFLREIFVKYQITHVAHMAAQAGVRYSLENPLAYVKANVQCQLALLNAIRDFSTEIKVVYASSSSVYGKESEIPFRLSAPTDHPGNMYAATKKTDELMALHYCKVYGIRSVGLRFFTVYGEWGRPDMSVYKFAEAIVNGKEIPMFHVSDDQPLGRDFTYVDDVVAGIISAFNYQPRECGERFNLGFGNPVSVPDMIKILQEELGVQGKIQKLPLPPTEILRTWADIRTSTQVLNFQPKTNLTMGLRAFVRWFKPYIEQREREKKSGQVTDSMKWYARLLEDHIQRQKRYNSNVKSRKDNAIFPGDENFKESRKIESQADQKLPIYGKVTRQELHEDNLFAYHHVFNASRAKLSAILIEHRNVDSPGGDYLVVEGSPTVEQLKKVCAEQPICIGFTKNGTLKKQIKPLDEWTVNPNHDSSLFVYDTNYCHYNAKPCPDLSDCTCAEQHDFKCVCKHNHIMANGGCVKSFVDRALVPSLAKCSGSIC